MSGRGNLRCGWQPAALGYCQSCSEDQGLIFHVVSGGNWVTRFCPSCLDILMTAASTPPPRVRTAKRTKPRPVVEFENADLGEEG